MAAAQRFAVRRVFLSSTARDLAPHREAVSRAIAGLDGFQCVWMEDFGARPSRIACRRPAVLP